MASAAERGPHRAVGEHASSLGTQAACHRCGLALGTNHGRCLACFDAKLDDRLARYCDWLVATCQRPDKLAETYAAHGALLK